MRRQPPRPDLILLWEDEERRERTWAPRTHRIVIGKSTTWASLSREVTRRQDEPLVVTGAGAWARRLIERLAREIPNVTIAPRKGNLYRATVRPTAIVAWETFRPST
jgi:hypothetical protein